MKYRRNSDEEIRNLTRVWETSRAAEDLDRLNNARQRAGLPLYYALKPNWSGVLDPPPEAPAAWGARAIIERGSISLVGDRQELVGEPASRDRLRELLNGGIIAAMRQEAARLLRRHIMVSDDAEDFVLHDSPEVRVVGNTNASHGYVYIVAFLKPPGWSEPLITRTCEACQKSSTDLGECSVCSKTLCEACREECPYCNQYVCEGYHDIRCRSCEELICTSAECERHRRPRYCDKCGEPYCYDCRAEVRNCTCDEVCDECGDSFEECSGCGDIFCSCRPCSCSEEEEGDDEESTSDEESDSDEDLDEDYDRNPFDADDDEEDDSELGGWAVIHVSGDLIMDGFESEGAAWAWLDSAAEDGQLDDEIDAYTVTEVED